MDAAEAEALIQRIEMTDYWQPGQDADIAVSIFPERYQRSDSPGNHAGGWVTRLNPAGKPCATEKAPEFTRSIDRAMELVPDRWDHISVTMGPPGAWSAEVGNWNLGGGGEAPHIEGLSVGHALGPARAICIAALRARASLER